MLFVSKKVAVQIYLKIYHFNDLSAEKQQSINMILGGGMPFEHWKCWQFLHFYDTPPAFTLRFLEVIILNEFYDVKNSWESPLWWYQMMEKPAHHPNVPKAKVVPIIKHHFSYVSLGELNMQQFTMCSLIKNIRGSLSSSFTQRTSKALLYVASDARCIRRAAWISMHCKSSSIHSMASTRIRIMIGLKTALHFYFLCF